MRWRRDLAGIAQHLSRHWATIVVSARSTAAFHLKAIRSGSPRRCADFIISQLKPLPALGWKPRTVVPAKIMYVKMRYEQCRNILNLVSDLFNDSVSFAHRHGRNTIPTTHWCHLTALAQTADHHIRTVAITPVLSRLTYWRHAAVLSRLCKEEAFALVHLILLKQN